MDALANLSSDALVVLAYGGLLGISAIGSLLIHRGLRSFDSLFKRVRRIEFWLARQIGFNPNKDDDDN